MNSITRADANILNLTYNKGANFQLKKKKKNH